MVAGRVVMLAAGGTGGHLFPAQALAEELVSRNYVPHLMTDERVRDYGKSFPAAETHIVPAATFSLSDPLRIPLKAWRLYNGYRQAKSILRKTIPGAVVGFGGYPSFAPLSAAVSLGLPTIVHEQNAVLGRANAQLAKKVQVIAGSFPDVIGMAASNKSKFVFTGNPVRAIVLKHAGAPYQLHDSHGKFRLLVFGGSQGARFFSDFMPDMFAKMDSQVRQQLHVIQQCRKEDVKRTEEAYSALGLSYELNSFFADLPALMASSQLVVARSGASTIAELGVIGRPAALVPLPGAIDNDQLRNAESFSNAGAGWVFPQASLAASSFVEFLERLIREPDIAKSAATQALTHGRPDAAKNLADVVEKQITGQLSVH